jgi:CDP-glucose 4,6-dehydratase
MVEKWRDGASWQLGGGKHPHEANYLKLDIANARSRLGWHPRWKLADALEHIITWHRAWLTKEDMRAHSLGQIRQYNATA